MSRSMNQKITLALIAIIPACLTAIAGYTQGQKATDLQETKSELSSKSISFKRSQNPNYKELIYPNYGISLSAPISWTTEDSPARLAGGEFNLISRYEGTKAAIGMNFRLRPVQPNYINDIKSQVDNHLVTLQKNYLGANVADTTISGLTGKVFTYEMPTGERKMLIHQYWIRLVPDVQLQIHCAQYTDAPDVVEFWKDVDQVVSSIVIAFDSWQGRYKKDKNV